MEYIKFYLTPILTPTPGCNEMLRQIEPERIICYNTPFPEMEGNIVRHLAFSITF